MDLALSRAVKAAQAEVRQRVSGWDSLAADLLMAHGCGTATMARHAATRLVQRYSASRCRRDSPTGHREPPRQ